MVRVIVVKTTDLTLDDGNTVSGCIYTDSNIYEDDNFQCFAGRIY